MIPNLKWAFIISNNYSWFDSFVRNLGGNDISIIVDQEDDKPDAYAWSSPHLSELNDLQQVADRASALKSIFDGALFINLGDDYYPIRFLELVHLPDEKRCQTLKGNFLSNPFASDFTKWQFPRIATYNPFESFTSTMLFLARHDENAKGMLQFLGLNGITWISLYALLDFMKQGGWGDSKIVTAAGSSKEELKRFTQTANNFAAIGPFARHGEKGWTLPVRIMTLQEASALILKAVKVFLINRCNTLQLERRWANGEI